MTGVYYGWASVDGGDIHKMVMSIGWNPYYKNKTKSMVSCYWESIQGPPVSQANACTAKKWDMIKENESDVAD